MVLPVLALALRSAAGAALRSGAAGRGIGGVARIGKTAGELRSARTALSANPGNVKLQDAAAKSLKDFSSSLGVNVPEIVQSIKEWRDHLVESGKALVQYNGTIAKAYQQLAIGDIQRKVRLAKSTAGSTAALVESENRRRETGVNFEALSTNIQNQIATVVNNATAAVGEMLDPIAETLNKLVQVEEKQSDGTIAGLEPLKQLAQRQDRQRPKRIDV